MDSDAYVAPMKSAMETKEFNVDYEKKKPKKKQVLQQKKAKDSKEVKTPVKAKPEAEKEKYDKTKDLFQEFGEQESL